MKELFIFYLQLCVVLALPGLVPTSTLVPNGEVSGVLPQPPSPTPPPPPHHELVKRNISANICGWVNGKVDEPLTCLDPAATCLWDSDATLVSCVTSAGTILPPFSANCVDHSVVPTAANIQQCPSSAPICNTAQFPNSYMMYPCGQTKTQDLKIKLSGIGLPTPISLPQFLDSKTGQVYHKSVTTDFSQKGSIIAACVGGGVLLLGLPFGIKMLIRKRNWRKAEKAPKTRNLRHPFVREQLPPGPNFLFSQEWHGAPSPPYPKAHTGSGG
ncbi:hypothetical protein B0O99DRAFT_588419 [Bisporella sp. PMI_857]|nr:hypothetical protein B0O99DRAFT_588419 [Bisporella sp. PMI_857]